MNQPLFIFDWLKAHDDSKLEISYDPKAEHYVINLFVGKETLVYGATIHVQPFEARGMTERRLINEVNNLHNEALKKQNEQQ